MGTADPAAGSDFVRSIAQRADTTITEIDGSHVVMISQPDMVTDVIRTARNGVGGASEPAATLETAACGEDHRCRSDEQFSSRRDDGAIAPAPGTLFGTRVGSVA